jgi:hypothetical protein
MRPLMQFDSGAARYRWLTTNAVPARIESSVMAGLVPAIHVFLAAAQTWMPGTRPGMTERVGQVEREPL